MEDFVTFKISQKLKEKGFNEKCLFAYNDEQIINPKVVEEYGDLSDDGYYELTKNGGGKLKWDNVYIYEQQIILRDKIIIKRNFIDAPTISQVLKWLRGKDIMVEIPPVLCDDGTWSFSFRVQTKKLYDRSMKDYTSYEEAALACIEHVLDNLI